MKLVLDPGGTRLKFGAVRNGQLDAVHSVDWLELQSGRFDPATLARETGIPANEGGLEVHVLNRKAPPAAGKEWLSVFCQAWGKPEATREVIDPLQNAGFDIAYTSGHPGSDRIAAAVACQRKDPGGSFIIVDAGTCITVDLLSPGSWRGGAIMPGLQLQANAMKQAGLPILQADDQHHWPFTEGPEGALGRNTMDAIAAGIPWATRKSVEAIAQAYKVMDPCAQVVLTGGDAPHFDGVGGWQTFANPNLVLQGCAMLLNEHTT